MTAKSKLTLAALALAAFTAPATARDKPTNRSIESVHQPVVSYASYTFDVQAGSGGLPDYEARRLNDWFNSIDLSYGDQVSVVTDGGYSSPTVRDNIADVVARHGLLVGEDSSAVAGVAPEGAIRLIVRRATASVPGCPDWSTKAETNIQLGASSNFGCGINGNLAAMIANPEDLVRGQTTDTNLRTVTSNRAISTYRDKPLTGAAGLQTIEGGK